MKPADLNYNIAKDDVILVTGATGFIGSRLVKVLLERGFRNLRCFTRSANKASRLTGMAERYGDGVRLEIFPGNLLRRDDCEAATKDAALVFHLAAGRGEKSYADAFMNSAVATRNLLDAVVGHGCLRRFVNISSFAVYTNAHGRALDESSPVETEPALRGDPYCFAKVKQEQIVQEYGKHFGISYTIIRPGHVYGPGNEGITGRVGISTFGPFLHLGGSNPIPVTYVDNCAEAIALAGLKESVKQAEIFNVVDDNLPTSRELLRFYKKNIRRFGSIYVPHAASYVFCYLWERYSAWSQGQLEPVFNRRRWRANWRKATYSNSKLKRDLGWKPAISTAEGLRSLADACRVGGGNA